MTVCAVIRWLCVCVFCYKRVPCCNFVLTVTGECLQEAGEVFKQLADHKYALEDNVKQNFLGPLADLQSKDLKEVNVGQGHSIWNSSLAKTFCSFMFDDAVNSFENNEKNCKE